MIDLNQAIDDLFDKSESPLDAKSKALKQAKAAYEAAKHEFFEVEAAIFWESTGLPRLYVNDVLTATDAAVLYWRDPIRQSFPTLLTHPITIEEIIYLYFNGIDWGVKRSVEDSIVIQVVGGRLYHRHVPLGLAIEMRQAYLESETE